MKLKRKRGGEATENEPNVESKLLQLLARSDVTAAVKEGLGSARSSGEGCEESERRQKSVVSVDCVAEVRSQREGGEESDEGEQERPSRYVHLLIPLPRRPCVRIVAM